MNFVHVIVQGHPVAKGRARSGLIPKKGGGYVADKSGRPVIAHYTPPDTRKWEDRARGDGRVAMNNLSPENGPLRLSVVAYFAPSESWPEWKKQAALDGAVCHTAKPDADNLVKAAKDAMNGIVWLDDSQVVEFSAAKRYSTKPRVEITVERMLAASSRITKRSDLGKTSSLINP